MPVKKKAPAKKAVLGPKAKLMKLSVTTLRSKAKKLGISNVTTRTKENLAQSIMLAEARKKRGTTAGKKTTAKRSANPNRQIGVPKKGSDRYWADASRKAQAPGRRTSKSGKVYYERRANRSDVPGTFAGMSEKYNGWTNYWTWKYNLELLDESYWRDQIEEGYYSNIYDLSKGLEESADELIETAGLPDWAEFWISAAFSEINWYEIAKGIAEDFDLPANDLGLSGGNSKRQKMMDLLKKKYKFDFVRTTEEFDGSPGGIWVTGEGPQSVGGKRIYDYYKDDTAYELGVLRKFEQALNKLGWYSEWYDPGTIMIWPD